MRQFLLVFYYAWDTHTWTWRVGIQQPCIYHLQSLADQCLAHFVWWKPKMKPCSNLLIMHLFMKSYPMYHARKCTILVNSVKTRLWDKFWKELEFFCQYFYYKKFTASNGIVIYVRSNANEGYVDFFSMWFLHMSWAWSNVGLCMHLPQNWTKICVKIFVTWWEE